LRFTEVIRQRPSYTGSMGSMEIFFNDAERKTERPGDLALPSPSGTSQKQLNMLKRSSIRHMRVFPKR